MSSELSTNTASSGQFACIPKGDPGAVDISALLLPSRDAENGTVCENLAEYVQSSPILLTHLAANLNGRLLTDSIGGPSVP